MKNTTKLAITTKTVAPIVADVKKLVVASDADTVVATEILSRANKKLDEVIEYKETKTKPLNEALKVIRAETREVENVLSEVVATIKGKLSAYETAKRFKIRAEEERLAKAVDTGKVDIDEAAGKLAVIERAKTEEVVAESGKITYREDKLLKITDEKKIPRVFLMADEDKILEALKAGAVVPGCEIEIVMTPINRRK